MKLALVITVACLLCLARPSASQDDTTLPSGDTTLPSGDTTLPSGDTTLPSGDTTLPSGDTTTGSTYKCPDGFTEDPGDVFGNGIKGEQFSADSIEECGEACQEESTCNSFNFSPTKNMCVIYEESQPTDPEFEDYGFCKKDGTTDATTDDTTGDTTDDTTNDITDDTTDEITES